MVDGVRHNVVHPGRGLLVMSAPTRPATVLTLDRLRLAVVRNTSTARRQGDVSVDPLVSAARAQSRAVDRVLRPLR